MTILFQRVIGIVLLSAFSMSCASTDSGTAKKAAPHADNLHLPETARIEFVNEKLNYVILRAEFLPKTGQEAIVVRGDRAVGKIIISGPIDRPFAAADIVQGSLQRGDHIGNIPKVTTGKKNE